MYFCVADKAFLSSTTISTLALHAYLSRHSLLPSILLYESSGVLSSGVGAFGIIRKPESYHIVSRYQVATPSRTITARATGPKVIADSLMRTSSRTPGRFCGADHRKGILEGGLEPLVRGAYETPKATLPLNFLQDLL